jgi:hypothetical protein
MVSNNKKRIKKKKKRKEGRKERKDTSYSRAVHIKLDAKAYAGAGEIAKDA